jgi:NAD+ kinase
MAIRAAICGRNLADLRQLLQSLPIEIVEQSPELVICYGGDGSLLGAERDFPGIPKCPVRDSRANAKCPEHAEERVLEQLVAGQLRPSRLAKIEAVCGERRRVVGLNDVVISKKVISSAVRCRVWLDDELLAQQTVGDGLVVATPFGSTGYYRSITHSLFRLGLGIAFNNTKEPVDHLVVPENTTIRVEMIRGPAVLLADNDPTRVPLRRGDRIVIQRTPGQATVLGLDVFRCKECERLRQRNENPV